MGINLPFDRVDIVNCRKIEVLAPNKGFDFINKTLAEFFVSGDRVGLDHGTAFPIETCCFIIGHGSIEREGQRRGAGIWSETKVSSENIAVFGSIIQTTHQIPRQSHHPFLYAAMMKIADFFGIIEDDEVNI